LTNQKKGIYSRVDKITADLGELRRLKENLSKRIDPKV
jgi:hypothetical protein